MFSARREIRLSVCLLLLLNVFDGLAQEDGSLVNPPSIRNSVEWVSQYPSEKNASNKSAIDKLANLLFGKTAAPSLTKPMDIFAWNSESFSVLDQANGLIFHVDDNKTTIPKAIKKSAYSFTSLVGLCGFIDQDILFTDSRLNCVYRLNEKENSISQFGDTLGFKQPTGIAYSPLLNEVWVVETALHRISVLNELGELVRTIGKRGSSPGEFNFPTSIWIDKTGKVYVVDAMNFRIQVLASDGKIISVFGKQGNATGYFARPKGVATDSDGNIYVVDALYHTVQIFDIYGNYLAQFGAQGKNDGQFWMPSGIFIDDADFIYVADSYNSRIQIFKLVKGE